jgi:hypothetical protein
MKLRAFRPGWFFWCSLLLGAAGALAIAFLPWESVGAPVLAVLLVGGAALGLALWDSPDEERRFVVRLFLAAFALRLLAALVFTLAVGGNEGYLYSDANSYDRVAWALAQSWRTGVPAAMGPVEFVADDIYPRLLAGLYFAIGHSPLTAVVINTVLGAASVYLVYRLGAMLLDPVTARWAGWLTALYTGFWLWEMMTMKDALFLFLILLFFMGLYRLWAFLFDPERSARRLLTGAAWALVLLLIFRIAGELRNYMPPVLIASAMLLPLAHFLRAGKVWRWLLVLGSVAAALAVFWPWISSRSLQPVQLGSQSMLGQVTDVPDTKTVGSFLAWILDDPLGFARYMALTTVSTALAPYAWLVPGAVPEVAKFETYMIGYPGMWMWYVLIPFSGFGMVQAVRRSKGEAWPLIFYAAAVFLIVSIFIPREARHRDMMMPLALLFAAEGLVFSRRWWALGMLVWIPLIVFIAWKLSSLAPILLAAGAAAVWVVLWHVRLLRRRDALLVRLR